MCTFFESIHAKSSTSGRVAVVVAVMPSFVISKVSEEADDDGDSRSNWTVVASVECPRW